MVRLTWISLSGKTWYGCTSEGHGTGLQVEHQTGRQIQQRQPGMVRNYKTKATDIDYWLILIHEAGPLLFVYI